MATETRSYKDTLNLPKTGFAMKANLVQNEPASLKRWDKLGVYRKLREMEHPRGPFVFHDGPPYANGDIHLGHLLNKVLKDLVVRSRSMMGYNCPYTPGWDCHGLPIEHKVLTEQARRDEGTKGRREGGAADVNPSAASAEALAIRKQCAKYAGKFVKTQSRQMQRLLTLGDYDNPYLTMLPKYEAGVLEVFAGMLKKGLVYRDLKPVHWSIDNQTALAEAELEYYDREDMSVYVRFDVVDRDHASDGVSGETGDARAAVPERLRGRDVSLMIWTTTPWTLPANLAVAVNERYEYGLYPAGERHVILATALAGKVLAMGGFDAAEPVETFTGTELLGLEYRHPFAEQVGRVVAAEYVTLEDGTGLVHTAPGHGVEDYQTGLREGLGVYCPVRADGTYDDTVPDWLRGESIWKANDAIVERLRDSGHLFHAERFTHSYPHDWRGKKPVIFRATEQWFVGVDREVNGVAGDAQRPGSLRNAALSVTADEVMFYPEWGRSRMRGMLESRPDWCISRQRAWGLPIPAFFYGGEALLTPESVEAVARKFAEKGSDCWFYLSVPELLESYDPRNDPDVPDWFKKIGFDHLEHLEKGGDTFDVWFESGSSWNAVLREGWADHQARPVLRDGHPGADLYLEGSDQHRGWFQHSLLPALAVTGESPFRGVLTHGFMVDKDGRKMSKSGGNALAVDDLMKDFGADVCRWWVASLNPENDIKADASFFKLAGEEYRKVRNTLRFLLSNLSDFDRETMTHHFTDADAASVDAWAMGELASLMRTMTEAYEGYRFRRATEALYDFCNDTLSAVYLAAVKDRLYCDAANSPRRRRTQTACYKIAAAVCRLLAPILPHTADEAWRALHDASAPGSGSGEDSDLGCVHLERLPDPDHPNEVPVHPAWPRVMAYRDELLRSIERYRQGHEVDNPLALGLAAPGPAGVDGWDDFAAVDVADLCGVSRFERLSDGSPIEVQDLSDEPRCERSWKRDGTVKQRRDGGMLSDRDAAAVGLT